MKSIITLTLLCGAAFTPVQALPPATRHSVSDPTNIEDLASSEQTPARKGLTYDISAMLQGFVICQTSSASPEADEAAFAIQALRARLYTPAKQGKVDPPLCTELTRNEYAVTAICGPHGTTMRSMDAGKMANQIYRFCRVEVEGEWRMGGQYIFNSETVPVSLVQVYSVKDREAKAGLDYWDGRLHDVS